MPTKFRAAMVTASAVLTLLAPTAASGDTGVITNITPLGGSNYQATYTVAVTTCSSSGYCGGYGYAWQVGPSDACDPNNYVGSLTWVGNIMSADVPGTDTGTDTFVAAAVPFKLCLGTNHASPGRQTVAEAVYTAAAPVPAPAPPVAPSATPTTTPTAAVTPTTPAITTDGQKCSYWSGQETKRGKAYNTAKRAYKKKRTSARRRAMLTALEKLRTAERKALSACG